MGKFRWFSLELECLLTSAFRTTGTLVSNSVSVTCSTPIASIGAPSQSNTIIGKITLNHVRPLTLLLFRTRTPRSATRMATQSVLSLHQHQLDFAAIAMKDRAAVRSSAQQDSTAGNLTVVLSSDRPKQSPSQNAWRLSIWHAQTAQRWMISVAAPAPRTYRKTF
jgi:hypothetical protein